MEDTLLLACKLAKKSAQIAISRAINEYRIIAKAYAPGDELSLQSQKFIVIGTRYSANS